MINALAFFPAAVTKKNKFCAKIRNRVGVIKTLLGFSGKAMSQSYETFWCLYCKALQIHNLQKNGKFCRKLGSSDLEKHIGLDKQTH
jgi:hypothetical protein